MIEHQTPRWFRWFVLATSALLLLLGAASLVFAVSASSIGEGIIRGAAAFILIFYGVRRIRLIRSN